MTLDEYHHVRRLPGGLHYKAGARGYGSELYQLLAETLPSGQGLALDLNPGIGVVSAALQRKGYVAEAIETSFAAFRCLQLNTTAHIGLPWEATPQRYDLVALVLPAERGQRYVELCLLAAQRALKPGGVLWLVGQKNKGFERYWAMAQNLLGPGKMGLRQGMVRVASVHKQHPTATLPAVWESFEALGQTYRYLPGVFSAGELDAATQLLLQHLPNVANTQVLDLGCGYGALALALTQQGATVCGLEDDYPSFLSAQANQVNVLHSDIDFALPKDQLFDIVVTNPPFHLGGNVILEVAQAFVWAAHARLKRGGRFYLVANSFLKYEPLVAQLFGQVKCLANGPFKVLLAQRDGARRS